MPQHRFIYNCDGNNTFIHNLKPMTREDVYPFVDEVAITPITTFFMSCHNGMDMNYPSEISDFSCSQNTEEQEAELQDPEKNGLGTSARGVLNMRALINSGHDPLGLMLERSTEKGMETFVTFRLNEVHCVEEPNSWLLSRFWKSHPEYHIGTPGDPLPELYKDILGPVSPVVETWIPGGLDFSFDEVRQWRLKQIAEICEKYPIDGLELDFQRFPCYFKFGQEKAGMPYMNDFVQKVRSITNKAGDKREKPMLLSVRTMATLEQNLGLGIDPISWANDGLLDFVIVSHYLRNTGVLPIGDFREQMPDGMPIYASLEWEPKVDRYRELAPKLWEAGADGLSMFNFFATREGGVKEPPWEVLGEIGGHSDWRL